MRGGFGRPAAALAAAALMAVAVLASPPAATACTGCAYPFRDWIAGKPVALYRFDGGRSRWSEVKEWDTAGGCEGLAGTFVFRRLATLQGRAPATITVRVTSAEDDCPWWYTARAVPTGRWIVVGLGSSWWHVNSRGVVDTWGEGEGGPESVPHTLAGWQRDLSAPDTATADPAAPPGLPASMPNQVLIAAGAGGLLVGWRRRAPR